MAVVDMNPSPTCHAGGMATVKYHLLEVIHVNHCSTRNRGTTAYHEVRPFGLDWFDKQLVDDLFQPSFEAHNVALFNGSLRHP